MPLQSETSESSMATELTELTPTTTASLDCSILTPPCDPFRKPFPSHTPGILPNSMYIHPHSKWLIPSEYWNKLGELVELLRENIERKLGQQSGDIEFDLFMAGPLTQEIQSVGPAIVVVCQKNILKRVHEILTHKNVLNNIVWPLTIPIARRGFLGRLLSYLGTDQEQNCLPLGLEFWCCDAVRKPLRGMVDMVSRSITPSLPLQPQTSILCGSKITSTYGHSSATVSCAISVGGQVFGLTAAHAFRDNNNQILGTLDCSALQTDLSLTLTARRLQLRDEVREGVLQHANVVVVTGTVLLNPTMDSVETKVWMAPIGFYESSEPDLDWALFELNNVILLESSSNQYILSSSFGSITGVVQDDPDDEVEVIILNSNSVPARGTLTRGKAFSARYNLATIEMWIVDLYEDQSLRTGDSGSLVVDPCSGLVYGIVSALNAFDQAQIIPLWKIFKQIGKFVGTSSISLASTEIISQERGRIQDENSQASLQIRERISEELVPLRTSATAPIMREQPVILPKSDVLPGHLVASDFPVSTQTNQIGHSDMVHYATGSIIAYPDSDDQIPQGYHAKFQEIIGMLRLNVKEALELQANEVQYMLLQCGIPTGDLRPAVVVVCRQDDIEQVQKVLTQPWILENCGLFLISKGVDHMIQSLRHPSTGQRDLPLGLIFVGRSNAANALSIDTDVQMYTGDIQTLHNRVKGQFTKLWEGSLELYVKNVESRYDLSQLRATLLEVIELISHASTTDITLSPIDLFEAHPLGRLLAQSTEISSKYNSAFKQYRSNNLRTTGEFDQQHVSIKSVGKRIRQWKSRCRTGCRTCRLRGKQCDGKRPICLNCLKGGRICGYGVPQSLSFGIAPKILPVPQSMFSVGGIPLDTLRQMLSDITVLDEMPGSSMYLVLHTWQDIPANLEVKNIIYSLSEFLEVLASPRNPDKSLLNFIRLKNRRISSLNLDRTLSSLPFRNRCMELVTGSMAKTASSQTWMWFMNNMILENLALVTEKRDDKRLRRLSRMLNALALYSSHYGGR